MEVEVAVTDHFYVFDNVAVFPTRPTLQNFPNFQQKILNAGYNINQVDGLVFAAVTSNHLITEAVFDDLKLFGCAVLNLKSQAIDFFRVENESRFIKSRILDIISNTISDDIYLDLYTNNPNFDIDANYFVKYGFIEPKLVKGAIRLKYSKRPSTKLTLMQIRVAVASLKSDVVVIHIFLPKVVAITLSKCIKEINEAAGNLSILKYNDSGVAIMGLNSDNITSGDEGSVGLPEQYSPFVFHTHPDHITREYKAFISWPSGQDMMVVVLSFFQFRNQLAHFVPSPEGIWIIHVTPEFQKLLIKLRTKNSYTCAHGILGAIHQIFTQFEDPRSAELVEAINRYNIGGQYLAATKKYKLSNLMSDVPELNDDCQHEIYEDAQLFNVSLIKWKHFTESAEEGVYLTFDYVSDILGGLPPIIFPSSDPILSVEM